MIYYLLEMCMGVYMCVFSPVYPAGLFDFFGFDVSMFD